jgi:hypothetical protein
VKGNITRRGKNSWRLKFDDTPDPATGERRTRFATVRGKRADAQKALTQMLAARDGGTLVAPANTTVKQWFDQWLADPVGGRSSATGKS